MTTTGILQPYSHQSKIKFKCQHYTQSSLSNIFRIYYNRKVIQQDQWHITYASPYSNLAGLVAGLAFGYIFYKYKNERLFITKVKQATEQNYSNCNKFLDSRCNMVDHNLDFNFRRHSSAHFHTSSYSSI
jgi:hypothetical protein